MKKIINLGTLRVGIATTLCLSFLIYPELRVSSAGLTATRAAADLKSESQFRSEAARFDAAIRAINGISTMKLETGDDLKRAIAILDRERPNLKFHRSKLVVLVLGDSIFMNAVKKKAPDKQTAEAFAKELNANRQAIFKLDGAESLKTRIRGSVESDAATLRRAGGKLKEAAQKLKKAGQGGTAPNLGANREFKVIRASFSQAEQPLAANDSLITTPQDQVSRDFPRIKETPPENIAIALVLAAAVYIVGFVGLAVWELIVDLGSETSQEAECQKKADEDYTKCVAAASALPSGFPLFLREAATGLCYAAWLLAQAECLLFA